MQNYINSGKKTKKPPAVKRSISLLLTFVMALQMFLIMPLTITAANEKLSLVEYDSTIIQNGEILGGGDKINGSLPFDFKLTFSFPVYGDRYTEFKDLHPEDEPTEDDIPPSTYIDERDVVFFTLPAGVIFETIPSPIEMRTKVNTEFPELGDLLIGTVSFSNNVDGSRGIITIIFQGDTDKTNVFTDYETNITGSIEVTLKYDKLKADGSGEDETTMDLPHDIVIIDAPEYELVKDGEFDDKTKTITWTVEITTENVQNLSGYTFSDILPDYIHGTFKIEDKVYTGTYDNPTKKFEYTFKDIDNIDYSPVKLTFQTTAPDATAIDYKDYVENTAELKDSKGTIVATSNIARVDIPPTYVTKVGAIDAANPANIAWTITIHNHDRTITDVVIEDTLSKNATLVGVYLLIGSEETRQEIPKSPPANPDDGPYYTVNDDGGGTANQTLVYLGDISQPTKLVILSTRTYTGSPITPEYVDNSIKIRCDNVSYYGIGGRTMSGEGIFKKTGTWVTDSDVPQVEWKITNSFTADHDNFLFNDGIVYDLIVHSQETAFSKGFLAALKKPNVPEITCTTWDDQPATIQGWTTYANTIFANNNRKFVENSINYVFDDGSGGSVDYSSVIDVQVYKLYWGGTYNGNTYARAYIADLVVATPINPTLSAPYSFSFKYQVFHPLYSAENSVASPPVNSATVAISDTSTMNFTGNATGFTTNMLRKDVIPFGKEIGPTTPYDSKTESDKVYNFANNSVTFRLKVNENNYDFSKMVNDHDRPSGIITVTDTLPVGWEVKNFPGEDTYYKVYRKVSRNDTDLSYTEALSAAQLEALEFEAIPNGNVVKFVFGKDDTKSTLDATYIILLNAGPTKEKLSDYIDVDTGKLTTGSLTNNAIIAYKNWTPAPSVNFGFSATGDPAFTKFGKRTGTNGEAKWTIKYLPFDDTKKGTHIIDVIPQGVTLILDNDGDILLGTGGIEVYNLNKSGESYTVGAPFNASELAACIKYDGESRELRFDIPDRDKGYQVVITAMLTGNVNDNIVNSATLMNGDDAVTEFLSGGVKIAEADVTATSQRGGSLTIKKVDSENPSTTLAGAKFVLYKNYKTADEKVIRGVTIEERDNGVVSMRAIPDGEYTLVETIAPAGYILSTTTYRVVVDTNGITTIDGSSETSITVPNVAKTYTYGDLTISKTVDGDQGDQTKKFPFTITFTGDDIPDDVTTDKHEVLAITGNTVTVHLSHDESVTLIGLPTGITYKIVESDNDDYTVTPLEATGTITENGSSAHFTNFKNSTPVGNLTISKIVSGDEADETIKFPFTITFTGDDIPDTITSSQGELPVTANNTVTVYLSHGESVTLIGLPTGITYTIVEGDNDGYIVTPLEATGTITENGSSKLFTNIKNSTPVGTLRISKTIPGENPDENADFTFVITFTGDDIPKTITSSQGELPVTPNNTVTVQLSHGESVTLIGIPVGIGYMVTENNYAGYNTTSTGAGGTISDIESAASFTNTRIVIPDDPDPDPDPDPTPTPTPDNPTFPMIPPQIPPAQTPQPPAPTPPAPSTTPPSTPTPPTPAPPAPPTPPPAQTPPPPPNLTQFDIMTPTGMIARSATADATSVNADMWDPLFDLFGPTGPAGVLKYKDEIVPEVAKTNDSFNIMTAMFVLISSFAMIIMLKKSRIIKR